MVLLALLAALTIWCAVHTVLVVRRDGYGPCPTDWTRVAERSETVSAGRQDTAG